VFKLGILGYSRIGVVLPLKEVTGSIGAFFTLMTITPMLMTTAIQRGFELFECLLVVDCLL